MKTGRYDSLDAAKLILCVLVVAIHFPPSLTYREELLAVCRVAVPLFFMISGFLFFRKWPSDPSDREGQKKRLLHFLKRTGTLYLAWFVVLLPVTVKYWSWYGYPLPKTLLLFVMNFFVGETFVNSWFLTSLMLGMSIIALLSRSFDNRRLFWISFVIYLVCCAFSAYGQLLSLPQHAAGEFNIKNSFLSALVWIVIGKAAAENEDEILRKGREERGRVFLALLLCAVVYALEYGMCVAHDWASTTDELITLVPLCCVLFVLILSSRVQTRYADLMRSVSTTTYCAHGSIGVVLRSAGKRFGIYFETEGQSFAAFVIVLAASAVLGLLIYWLKKRIKNSKFKDGR